MMTLDFRSEVEMWLFCACTMKKICNITAIIGTVQSLWSFVDLAMGQIPCLTECIYNKKRSDHFFQRLEPVCARNALSCDVEEC